MAGVGWLSASTTESVGDFWRAHICKFPGPNIVFFAWLKTGNFWLSMCWCCYWVYHTLHWSRLVSLRCPIFHYDTENWLLLKALQKLSESRLIFIETRRKPFKKRVNRDNTKFRDKISDVGVLPFVEDPDLSVSAARATSATLTLDNFYRLIT